MENQRPKIAVYRFIDDIWKPLDLKLLEKERGEKFIQIYINNEPYLRIADSEGFRIYHKRILEKTLEEFNLKSEFSRLPSGNIGQPRIGENYEMVGAGKMKLEEGKVMFFDQSGDYAWQGRVRLRTNKKHLEDIGLRILNKNLNGPLFAEYLIDIDSFK